MPPFHTNLLGNIKPLRLNYLINQNYLLPSELSEKSNYNNLSENLSTIELSENLI